MDSTRALVVFYSRTGTTQTVAHAIQEELGCMIERIVDPKRRRGPVGYLRASFDALFERPAAIRPVRTDARDYELVVVGTPIWDMSVSAPVRAYLSANRDRFRHVAFFCTCGGMGSARVFRQMQTVCGQAPVGTLALRMDEVDTDEVATKVRAFATALRSTSLPDSAAFHGELHGAPA